MLERLQYVKQRFDEISDLIIQPDVISDQKRYVQLNQEYKGPVSYTHLDVYKRQLP